MQDVIDFLYGMKGMTLYGDCLLWLFLISNLTAVLSYFSIPVVVGYFIYKRKAQSIS